MQRAERGLEAPSFTLAYGMARQGAAGRGAGR